MNHSQENHREKFDLETVSYDILFQQSNLGVIVLDTDFTILDANEQCLKVVRKNKKDVIGKYCYEVVKGFYAPCHSTEVGFDCPLKKTLRNGKSAHIIHEYTVSKNKTDYYNISTYPIKDKHGTVVRIIEIWRNITSEITNRWATRVKQIQADMKKIIQEDRLVSLGKLVASSVHEINNPIQGLLTFSHLMEDMLKDDTIEQDDLNKFKEYLAHMSRELERCGDIVSGLLAFSREAPVEFVNLDINAVVQSVLSLTGHKIELSNIVLKTDLFEKPLIINGDNNQLQQCFLNLIFNAIEAMPDGGELCISSGLDHGKKEAWVAVKDTGLGVDENNLQHIFDPFFTTKKEGEGTGLGLSIVYGLVKDHGGHIDVKSREGEGSAFVISFPSISMDWY